MNLQKMIMNKIFKNKHCNNYQNKIKKITKILIMIKFKSFYKKRN